jgi:hypothetical protein
MPKLPQTEKPTTDAGNAAKKIPTTDREFPTFRELARKLLGVSREEVVERESEWRKARDGR